MKNNDWGDDWDMVLYNRKLRRLADRAVLTSIQSERVWEGHCMHFKVARLEPEDL